MIHDDDSPKVTMFSLRLNYGVSGSIWKQFVGFFKYMDGEEPLDLNIRVFTASYKLRWTSCFLDRESTQGINTYPSRIWTNPRDLEE
jgi:hypothetical protein